MKVENLSDAQLYSLAQNKKLARHLKKIIAAEFNRRNYSNDKLEELALSYDLVLHQSDKMLTHTSKLLIILFPFPIPIHAIIANWHISKGHTKKWKQHWNFVTLGYCIWTVLVLLYARLSALNTP